MTSEMAVRKRGQAAIGARTRNGLVAARGSQRLSCKRKWAAAAGALDCAACAAWGVIAHSCSCSYSSVLRLRLRLRPRPMPPAQTRAGGRGHVFGLKKVFLLPTMTQAPAASRVVRLRPSSQLGGDRGQCRPRIWPGLRLRDASGEQVAVAAVLEIDHSLAFALARRMPDFRCKFKSS